MNGTGTQTARRHYLRGVADEPPPAVESGEARRDGLDWLTPTRTDHDRGISLDYVRDMSWAVHPSTVERARLLAAAALMDWQLLELMGDVRLCVSELVTNAIRHPQWPEDLVCASCFVTVRLRFDPQAFVTVDVEDPDPRPPAWPTPNTFPDTEENHGRGLWLVQNFSDGQDVWPRPLGGKTVRCWWDLRERELARPHRMFSGHPATRDSPP